MVPKRRSRAMLRVCQYTERHEASRGLFATAELLVYIKRYGNIPTWTPQMEASSCRWYETRSSAIADKLRDAVL